jgi:hypothetical protein
MHKWLDLMCFPRDDVRPVRIDELRILFAMVNKIKISLVKSMIKQWLENVTMVGAVECTSLITRVTECLGALSWVNISYISSPILMVDENYLVYGHTLKHAPDGTLVFFFPSNVNEILLPNPGYHLYKCRSLTYELQLMEAARTSNVSWRMTRSRSRNAVMDMPQAPPYTYYGYAGGYAPAGEGSRSTFGYHPGWEQTAQQQQAGSSVWLSVSSAEWDQPTRAHWNLSGGSSSNVTPPLFAACRSFSARGYHELS